MADKSVPSKRKLSDAIPMESVQRIVKLPVIESSLNIATGVYSRVKESNSVINWTLSTAESTVSRAVEHAIPVAEKLEKPLKRVDSLLCSSLDYVEAKVPAVKLPTHELLETTSNYVESKLQPALEKAAELKQYGVEKLLYVVTLFTTPTTSSAQIQMSQQSVPQILLTPATPQTPKEFCRVVVGTPSACPPPPPPTPTCSIEAAKAAQITALNVELNKIVECALDSDDDVSED